MIAAPPGFVQDTTDPTWWYDPTKDISRNDPSAWWHQPPQGFVQDPNSPDWYFDPSKDIAHDPEAWWNVNPALIEDPATKPLSFWTFEEVGQAANVAPYPNVADNWPGICRAAGLWGIAEPLVLIGFLGTMMKETGSLYPVREAWWIWDKDKAAAIRYYQDTSKHAVYSGGWQFHGKGYVQTTHDYNHTAAQEGMASVGITVDLIGNPDLLLVPEYAAHALSIYFINRGLVDACQRRDWAAVRRGVYGGQDNDGIAKLQRCDAILLPLAQQRGFA